MLVNVKTMYDYSVHMELNRQEIKALKAKVAELEKDKDELKKEVDKHRAGFVACMTGKEFTANNLRQQAIGVAKAAKDLNDGKAYDEYHRFYQWLNEEADELEQDDEKIMVRQ